MFRTLMAKDGTNNCLVCEIRICCICGRDMLLNRTHYDRLWVANDQGFLFKHFPKCPPVHQMEALPWHKGK